VYLDARYYAASAYQRHAGKLRNGSQPQDAEPFAAKALNGFQSVLKDAESAKLIATDAKVKGRIEQVEFGARIALANLYLSGTAKPAEAENILKPIKLSDDDKQAPKLWALRIRIKLEEGKVDEAAAEMQAALDKAPESRDLVGACRSLASTLDNRAIERSKANDRFGAAGLWKQATSYYLRSATGATNAEVAQIAERLMVIGLIANEVGEKVEGWFELPEFQAKDRTAWQGALDLYRRLAENDAMTYKARVGRASILGFLQKWDECEAELAKLFEENNVIPADRSSRALDVDALRKKPELLNAYLEWGLALRNPTTSGDEKARRAKASERLDRVFRSVPPDSKQWWFARYWQIQTLFDRGLYDDADVSLSSLERTNQDFDGDRFQLKLRFKKLKTDIALKVPKKISEPKKIPEKPQ
jgi:tetratricopeptide (TPR) repeat protein